jgi:hypothetical protein
MNRSRYAVIMIAVVCGVCVYCILESYNSHIQHIQTQIRAASAHGFLLTVSVLPVFYPCTNQNHRAYCTFFKLINAVKQKNVFHASVVSHKLSVKVCQLSPSNEIAWRMFVTIVDYAYRNNVFIWISAVTRYSLENEYNTFVRIRRAGYTNVGLTLATYHTSVHASLAQVLRLGGNVRLVKGHYRGDIHDWRVVTANFVTCALKLIDSRTFHALATHDFKLLRTLHRRRPHFVHTIEFAFYYSALPYVNAMLPTMPFVPIYKTLYIAYGRVIPYLQSNLRYIDIHQHAKRMLSVSRYKGNRPYRYSDLNTS